MGTKKFSLECFQIHDSVDQFYVNKRYNYDLSVGDLYYQVYFPLTADCYTFRTLESALEFLKLNFNK